MNGRRDYIPCKSIPSSGGSAIIEADGDCIHGFKITLEGKRGTTALDLSKFGAFQMKSVRYGSLVSDPHMFFSLMRTRREIGGMRTALGVTTGDDFRLTFYHGFGAKHDHNAAYPTSDGDSITINLPAVPEAYVTDCVWKITKVTTKRAVPSHFVIYSHRGLNVSEKTFSVPGAIASIEFMDTVLADGSAGVNPETVSFFDNRNHRNVAMDWEDAKDMHNMFSSLEENEAETVLFDNTSSSSESVIDVLSSEKVTIELGNGTGTSMISICTVHKVNEDDIYRLSRTAVVAKMAVVENLIPTVKRDGFAAISLLEKSDTTSAPVVFDSTPIDAAFPVSEDIGIVGRVASAMRSIY